MDDAIRDHTMPTVDQLAAAIATLEAIYSRHELPDACVDDTIGILRTIIDAINEENA